MGLIDLQAQMPLIPGVPSIKTVGTAIVTLDLSSMLGRFACIQVKAGRVYMRGGVNTAGVTVTTTSFFLDVDGTAPSSRDVFVTRDLVVMKLKATAAARLVIVTPT